MKILLGRFELSRFLLRFAVVTACLQSKKKRIQNDTWGSNRHKAFQNMKRAVSLETKLKHYNENKELNVFRATVGVTLLPEGDPVACGTTTTASK